MREALKVILLEDDLDQQQLVDAAFAVEDGVELKIFDSLQTTYSYLQNAEVDIFLLDLNLVDSTGTLYDIKSNYPNTPVIVVTGNQDLNVAKELLASGAQEYLIKGQFKYSDLPDYIANALERYKQYENLQKSNQQLSTLVNSIKSGEIDSVLSSSAPSGLYKLLDSADFEKMMRQLKDQRAELQRLADEDDLTGILNRKAFERLAEQALKIGKENSKVMALIMLDVDNFKNINDQYGHPIGDRLLKQMVRKVESQLMKTDFFARMGGDEFALLLTQLDKAEDATGIIDNFYSSLKGAFEVADMSFDANVSMGVACFPNAGNSLQELHKHADLALYRAKKKGKNQYQFYSDEIRLAYEQSLYLQKLVTAPFAKSFTQALQPIYAIAQQNKKIIGYEVLLRTLEPLHADTTVENIITVAEEAHEIKRIGEEIIAAAFKNYNELFAGKDSILTINLSVKQIEYTDFLEKVEELLTKFSVNPDCICFEITESALVETIYKQDLVKVLGKLRTFGCKIAIDDFGKGQSSLSRLIDISADYLKLDMVFVQNMVKDIRVQSIVRTIISLAKDLNLKVIAEGVETKEQLNLLESLGCHYAQGYLLGRPKLIDEIKSARGWQSG